MKNTALTALTIGLALSLMVGLVNAGPQQTVPPPPTDLMAFLEPPSTVFVLLSWVNNYVPKKKEGGSITVERGIVYMLPPTDPYFPNYSFISWRPISGALSLKTTSWRDVLPAGTVIADVRYRVIVQNLNRVRISSQLASIEQ